MCHIKIFIFLQINHQMIKYYSKFTQISFTYSYIIHEAFPYQYIEKMSDMLFSFFSSTITLRLVMWSACISIMLMYSFIFSIFDCLFYTPFCYCLLYGIIYIFKVIAFTYIVVKIRDMLPNHKHDYG